jgi:glutathione S-transferase
MLVLRSAAASPFGRKVKIAAAVLGLTDQLEIVAVDTLDPTDPIRQHNPLGKIPCLTTEDGLAIYDSRVIVEYLDHRAGGGKIIPPQPEKRFPTMVLQALADGIQDAAILMVYERRFRAAEKHEANWLRHQSGKIDRALAMLEQAPPTGMRDIGHIALACALGYLDLRFDGHWRQTHPKLRAWLDLFAKDIPAFETTRFVQAA